MVALPPSPGETPLFDGYSIRNAQAVRSYLLSDELANPSQGGDAKPRVLLYRDSRVTEPGEN